MQDSKTGEERVGGWGCKLLPTTPLTLVLTLLDCEMPAQEGDTTSGLQCNNTMAIHLASKSFRHFATCVVRTWNWGGGFASSEESQLQQVSPFNLNPRTLLVDQRPIYTRTLAQLLHGLLREHSPAVNTLPVSTLI